MLLRASFVLLLAACLLQPSSPLPPPLPRRSLLLPLVASPLLLLSPAPSPASTAQDRLQSYDDFTELPGGCSYKDVFLPRKSDSGPALAPARPGDRVVFDWSVSYSPEPPQPPETLADPPATHASPFASRALSFAQGYTIGYFGRPFQASGGPAGGAFQGEQDYLRTVLGSGVRSARPENARARKALTPPPSPSPSLALFPLRSAPPLSPAGDDRGGRGGAGRHGARAGPAVDNPVRRVVVPSLRPEARGEGAEAGDVQRA